MKRILSFVFFGVAALLLLAACEDTRKLGNKAPAASNNLKLLPTSTKLPADVSSLSYQAGFDGKYFISLNNFRYLDATLYVLESIDGANWQDTASFSNVKQGSIPTLFNVGSQFYLRVMLENSGSSARWASLKRVAQGKWVEDASAEAIYSTTVGEPNGTLSYINQKVVGAAQDTAAPYYSSAQKFATIDGQQAVDLTHDVTYAGYDSFIPSFPLVADQKVLIPGILGRKDGRRETGLVQGNLGETRLKLVQALKTQDQPTNYSYERTFVAYGNGVYLVATAPYFLADVPIDSTARQGLSLYRASQSLNAWTQIKDATLDAFAKNFSLAAGQEFYQLVTAKFVQDRFIIVADRKTLVNGSAGKVSENLDSSQVDKYGCQVITSKDLKTFQVIVLPKTKCESSRVLYGNGIFYISAQVYETTGPNPGLNPIVYRFSGF